MDFNFGNESTEKSTAGGQKPNIIGSFHPDGEKLANFTIGSIDRHPSEKHHSDEEDDEDFLRAETARMQKKITGIVDDFEHVDRDDPFADFSSTQQIKDPLIHPSAGLGGKGDKGPSADDFANYMFAPPAPAPTKNNLPKDFGFSQLTSTVQDTASDIGNFASNVGKQADDKINQIVDFMAAERNTHPKPTPIDNLSESLFDSKPKSSAPSFLDDFDNEPIAPPPSATAFAPPAIPERIPSEPFNPSPVKRNLKEENNEKFISSEDLLGDFKDERTVTPEPKSTIAQEKPSKPMEPFKPTTVTKPSTNDDSFDDFLKQAKKDSSPSKVVDIKSFDPIPPPSAAVTKPTGPAPKPPTPAPAKKPAEPPKQMISAEEMFYRFGLVESLIYWRDVKKSGIVFGAGLIILLAISCFSVISVFAYVSLLTLAGTVAFRIYKNVLGAVQKTSEGHPFREYLELDLNMSQDKVQQIVNVAVAHVNGFVSELRRLFLVEDLVDSIKFGVILWILTYIGAWFNGMTLVILAFIALFSLPKVYENNKQSIDTYLDLVRSKFLEITDKVKAAIPIGKKQESEKDK